MTRYIDPQAKLFGHMDKLALLQRGGQPWPINVEIDLSNRCSLGCEWCHFAYTHTRGPLAGRRGKPEDATPGGDLMDADLALSILAQLAEVGSSVTWSGGGEPTLHPAFDAIVRHAAALNVPQGLYTHGGHINGARAELLRGAMAWVYVSLDEANADDYQRSKGVDRFADACEGVRRLAREPGRATIGVGFLLHSDNYGKARRMARLALDDLGADYVQFRPVVDYDIRRPGETNGHTGWALAAAEGLAPLLDDPRVIADLARFEEYHNWQGHGYDVCYWSALQTVITPNGKAWTCCNTREFSGHELGDLSRETFREVWARRRPMAVNGDCRVMCRGHLANLALDELLRPRPHAAFV